MKEKISVIIPTYNRAKLIRRSIESILNQTYQNTEIIVIDDGSTDNTKSVVEKIKDKRIKYIKLKTNQGANKARNIGVEKATGKYICFQDSDDEFYKDKIEKQYKNIIKNNADLDFCKLNIILNENESFEFPSEKSTKEILNNKIVDELMNGNLMSTQAILMKKSVFEKYKFDETLPRFQDYDLVLRIVPKHKVSFTNEILANLYRQPDSISNNFKKMEDCINIMENKIYPITYEQQAKLLKYFIKELTYGIDGITNQINDINRKLIDQEQRFLEEKNKMDEKLKKLKDQNENNIKLNNQLQENYNQVINSKRYKIINKIFFLKDKIYLLINKEKFKKDKSSKN